LLAMRFLQVGIPPERVTVVFLLHCTI
jgi:hypothetical protein